MKYPYYNELKVPNVINKTTFLSEFKETSTNIKILLKTSTKES
jgi:hypothetical protein